MKNISSKKARQKNGEKKWPKKNPENKTRKKFTGKNLRKIMRFRLRLLLMQNIWGSDLEMKNFWRRIRKHGNITISGIKKREPVHCTGYSYEKDCVWKVKCFTIFWEEPCLLVKQGNLIYSGMKKSSMKNFLVGLTYA